MNINSNFNHVLNHRLFCILILFLFISKLQIAFAQDNLLDPTFGMHGKQISIGGKGDNKAVYIRRLNDGKILFGANVQYGKLSNLTLIKFESNGKLDSSFGNNGTLLPNVYSANHNINLDSSENIYIYGSTRFSDSIIRISKYNTIGELDLTFGIKGNLDLMNTNYYGQIQIKLRNNQIYIIGNLNSKNSYPYELQKYDLNGNRDNSFGLNGSIQFTKDIRRPDLEVTSDNKLIVAGGGDYNFIIRTYLQNGSLDSTFGKNGEVFYSDTIKRENVQSVQIQSDKKILISGRANIPSSFKYVARFTENGILDSTFANKGFLKVTTENAYPSNFYTFFDEKYLHTVHIERISLYNSITIKRFHLSGELDTTFASHGSKSLEFDRLSSDWADAFMDKSGNFLLANSLTNFQSPTFLQISSINDDANPDTKFGDHGKLNMFFGFNAVYASKLLSLNQNSFIQGGNQYYSWGSNIQLNKFEINGIPDSSWSVNGVFTPPRQRVFFNNWCGAVQTDGKILIGGSESVDTITDQHDQMYVCRILPGGQMDSSFGYQGVSHISDKYGSALEAYALAIEKDGSILVSGYSSYLSYFYPSIIRLDEKGSIKLAFERMKYLSDRVSNKILIAKDDKIYNIGIGYLSNANLYYSHITRYLPDGKLDLQFGDSASTIISTATNDIILSGALDQQERIVLVGYDTINGGDYEMLACRVLPNGRIDSSFANNGFFRYKVDNQNSLIAEVLIDKQGRIYLGGTGYKTTKQDFILLCLDENGKLLNSFGENGLVYADFDDGDDYITSMIFDSDENIILGGNSESTEAYYMALAKVLNKLNVGTIDDESNSKMQFIYPNPVTDQTTLKFTLNKPEKVSINISDLKGNTILTLLHQNHFNQGEHQMELKMPSDILPGYYLISICTESQMRAIKFIKL